MTKNYNIELQDCKFQYIYTLNILRMILRQLIFVLILIFISNPTLRAQDHDHDHEQKHHHHLNNEIGIAVGAVYIFHEEVFAPGLHLHYTRMLPGKMQAFGLGMGVETVLDEHKHYTGSIMFQWRPVHAWWISAGPGITWFQESSESRFSLHLETGYEFEIGKVHLGPMIEFAFVQGDQHLMLGIHLGIPF